MLLPEDAYKNILMEKKLMQRWIRLLCTIPENKHIITCKEHEYLKYFWIGEQKHLGRKR